MLNTASVTIDLAALNHNLQVVRALCPRSHIMAMLKADAYGHGAVPAAGALADADGFAVARLQEALELRAAGIRQRLLLLGTLIEPAELELCAQQQIDVTVHDDRSLAAVAACARRAAALRVWLKLDCGMHRVGLDQAGFLAAARLLSAHSGVSELIHMTHFSTTRDLGGAVMSEQLQRFTACHRAATEHSGPRPVSLANSVILIGMPELRTDWVRPGIMLYGENPLGEQQPLPLKAVMTLRAVIVSVRNLPAGEAVGYDGCWTSERASRIATVGIGYGDGYPRHARNGTPVWVQGQQARLVGRVSMDFITIDVTDCVGAQIGDEVELWGTQLPAATIADCAGTASYELFTGIGTRVSRHYLST